MSRRYDPFDLKSNALYTKQDFVEYYGPEKGLDAWNRGEFYTVGMKVRALERLEGEHRGQVVEKGAYGKVLALPGPGQDIDPNAVAEVMINGVRFDAYRSMIEPVNNDSRGPGRQVERRRDPNNGQMYSFQEFQDYYGQDARTKWQEAGRHGPPPRGGPRDRDGPPRGPPRGGPRDRPDREEKRPDPNEPRSRETYTRNEFIAHYGRTTGEELWEKAGRRGGDRPRDRSERGEQRGDRRGDNRGDNRGDRDRNGPEKRRDPNEPNSRTTYTRSEFIKHYGEREGAELWRKAGDSRRGGDRGDRVDRERRGGDRERRGGDRERRGGDRDNRDNRRERRGDRDNRENRDRRGGDRDRPERRSDPNEPKSKKTYTKAEFIEHYGKVKGEKLWREAGESSGRPEKRLDPNESTSKTYTKAEFIEHYGPRKGESFWREAEKISWKKGGSKDAPEKRPDPNEPGSKKTYTRAEFLEHYGKKDGDKVWRKAGEASGASARGGTEKRRDPNEPSSKKTYTKAEFLEHYGKREGENVWRKAGKDGQEKRRDPNDRGSRKTYTKAEFLEHYGKRKGETVWRQAGTPSTKGKDRQVKVEDEITTITIEREDGDLIGWSRDNLIVHKVDEGSPADKGGLKPPAKVVAINGNKVTPKTITESVKDAGLKMEVQLVEVRKDKSDPDKKYFTYAEFVRFYGEEDGKRFWKNSKPRALRRKKEDEEKPEEKTEEAKADEGEKKAEAEPEATPADEKKEEKAEEQ